MRKHGSVRFAPYYKLQWYDDRPGMHVWIDVQRQYATQEQAYAAAVVEVPAYATALRLMEVTERGRDIVAGSARPNH